MAETAVTVAVTVAVAGLIAAFAESAVLVVVEQAAAVTAILLLLVALLLSLVAVALVVCSSLVVVVELEFHLPPLVDQHQVLHLTNDQHYHHHRLVQHRLPHVSLLQLLLLFLELYLDLHYFHLMPSFVSFVQRAPVSTGAPLPISIVDRK